MVRRKSVWHRKRIECIIVHQSQDLAMHTALEKQEERLRQETRHSRVWSTSASIAEPLPKTCLLADEKIASEGKLSEVRPESNASLFDQTIAKDASGNVTLLSAWSSNKLVVDLRTQPPNTHCEEVSHAIDHSDVASLSRVHEDSWERIEELKLETDEVYRLDEECIFETSPADAIVLQESEFDGLGPICSGSQRSDRSCDYEPIVETDRKDTQEHKVAAGIENTTERICTESDRSASESTESSMSFLSDKPADKAASLKDESPNFHPESSACEAPESAVYPPTDASVRRLGTTEVAIDVNHLAFIENISQSDQLEALKLLMERIEGAIEEKEELRFCRDENTQRTVDLMRCHIKIVSAYYLFL